MMKYQKELEYIITYYQKEEKKRVFLKDKAIKSISKNVNHMKKLQEIEAKNIENRISLQMKKRDVKARDNKINYCNQMYYYN